MNIYNLPSNLLSKIYEFDPTYSIVLKEVHNEMIKISWTRFFKAFTEENIILKKTVIDRLTLIFDYLISNELYGTSHPDDAEIMVSSINNLSHYIVLLFGAGAPYESYEVFISDGSTKNFRDFIFSETLYLDNGDEILTCSHL